MAWCWGHCAHSRRSHVDLSVREVAWCYGCVHQWHGAMVIVHTKDPTSIFINRSGVVLRSCVLKIPCPSLSRRFNHRLHGNTPLFSLNVWLGIHWSLTLLPRFNFHGKHGSQSSSFSNRLLDILIGWSCSGGWQPGTLYCSRINRWLAAQNPLLQQNKLVTGSPEPSTAVE